MCSLVAMLKSEFRTNRISLFWHCFMDENQHIVGDRIQALLELVLCRRRRCCYSHRNKEFESKEGEEDVRPSEIFHNANNHS